MSGALPMTLTYVANECLRQVPYLKHSPFPVFRPDIIFLFKTCVKYTLEEERIFWERINPFGKSHPRIQEDVKLIPWGAYPQSYLTKQGSKAKK